MFWIPIMMAASAAMQANQQRVATKASNSATKLANQVDADNNVIANIQRTSNSITSAAAGALKRFNQSYETNEALRNYGDEYNKLESQKVQLAEQMTKGSFQNQLDASEMQGALAARSSAAGMGGSTMDMLSSTMELTADIKQRDMDSQYSDNFWALGQAEEDNLYNQMGLIMQQDVFLDDVSAAPIIASAPRQTQDVGGYGGVLMAAGAAFMQGQAQTGGFDKGGTMSNAATRVKSWFGNGATSTAPSTGSNSFFQLNGRI